MEVIKKISRVKNDKGHILEGNEACDYMSKYYATYGEILAKKFSSVWNEHAFSGKRPMECFNLKFIPMDVVEKLVKNIDASKSSGLPELNSLALKDAFTVLIPELTHLFNESLETGIFPSSWGTGYITPIPKEGDPLEPGNWRPISILPLPSKRLEQAVHHQVSIFLENNHILDQRQHGFRLEFSTSTAIFKLVKNLFDNYDNSQSSSCIFVDYKKAFETLDHDILCKKLQKYNFSQNSEKWFRSYLSNRKHIVRTKEGISSPSHVEFGVPQGSTLGPLLFILYVNDLLTCMGRGENGRILMYADNTVLYTTDPNPLNIIKDSQIMLTNLMEWCNMNKLTINISKTKHMVIPRNQNHKDLTQNMSISIATDKLHNVTNYRYLGVDLDQTLSFEKMVDTTYNKANRKLYSLKNILPYITSSIASLIYKICIRPIMEYADFLVDSCPKRATGKLINIQKRAVKIVDQARHKNSTYEDLLEIYNIEELAARKRKHHLSVMYRQARDKDNLVSYRPDTDLRSNSKIRFNKKMGQLPRTNF